MVRKYIFGEPIETDAVVKELASSAWSDGVFQKKEDDFHYSLKKDEIVYGLGENVRGINREGLRAGILTDYMTAYRYNNNLAVWPEAVPDGSTVLYVGPSQFYCMLGEHKQASPDTICPMIYDERLLDYWKINPDRYPDVVVFESCYGDIAQEGENSFIWNWLMEDFKPAERKDYPYITVFMR